MLTIIVVAVVSAALMAGALWGVYLPLPERLKGFLMAFAGGALVSSLAFELFETAIRDSGILIASIALMGGAVTFTLADYLVDEKWGAQSGGGLLAAVSLDGVPENLVLKRDPVPRQRLAQPIAAA